MTATSEQIKIGTEFLGKYQVLDSLGKGSMGLVFKARHKLMDRLVAIKTLIYADRDPRHRKDLFLRFHQEARAASALSHPNLVSIYDFGTLDDGNAYAVMDFVEGQTLGDYITQKGPVPAAECIEIVMQICAGLDHAHQKGVVHRDIKPSNIMISRTPYGALIVKVVDFGIAKLMPWAEKERESTNVAESSQVFGSPLYMSPEQCQNGTVDHRTDIYSLGCTMYKALTGVAFARDDLLMGVLHKHINVAPAPFAKVAPNIEIPPALEAVVMRALAKHPDERFRDMSAMLKAVRKVAGPATAGGVTGPTIRVLIADSSAADSKALQAVLSKNPEFEVVAQAKDGEDAIDKLLQTQPQVVVMDLHIKNANEAAKQIKEKFASIKVIGMTNEQQADTVLGAFSSGIDGYCIKRPGYENVSPAIRAVVYGGTWIDPAVASSFLRACAHASEQVNEEAQAKTMEIVSLKEKDEPTFITILGETYQSEGKTFEAETLYKAAIALLEKTKGQAVPELCGPLLKLADIYFAQAKSDEAQECYLRALALRYRGDGGPSLDVGVIVERLSKVSGGSAALKERIRKTMPDISNDQP
jgi:serine/threonine protein kinase